MASRYYNLKRVDKRLETPNEIEVTEATVGTYNIITVKKGSRLDNIAYDNYNDSSLWWVLATINELQTPFIEEEMNLIVPENVAGILAQL